MSSQVRAEQEETRRQLLRAQNEVLSSLLHSFSPSTCRRDEQRPGGRNSQMRLVQVLPIALREGDEFPEDGCAIEKGIALTYLFRRCDGHGSPIHFEENIGPDGLGAVLGADAEYGVGRDLHDAPRAKPPQFNRPFAWLYLALGPFWRVRENVLKREEHHVGPRPDSQLQADHEVRDRKRVVEVVPRVAAVPRFPIN